MSVSPKFQMTNLFIYLVISAEQQMMNDWTFAAAPHAQRDVVGQCYSVAAPGIS